MHFLSTLTLLLALLSGTAPATTLRPAPLAAAATHPTETVHVYEQDLLRLPRQRRLQAIESLHARSQGDVRG
jgi:hypothetical protein